MAESPAKSTLGVVSPPSLSTSNELLKNKILACMAAAADTSEWNKWATSRGSTMRETTQRFPIPDKGIFRRGTRADGLVVADGGLRIVGSWL